MKEYSESDYWNMVGNVIQKPSAMIEDINGKPAEGQPNVPVEPIKIDGSDMLNDIKIILTNFATAMAQMATNVNLQVAFDNNGIAKVVDQAIEKISKDGLRNYNASNMFMVGGLG